MALILSDLTIPIKLISLYDTRLFVVGLFSLSDKNITIAEKSPLITNGWIFRQLEQQRNNHQDGWARTNALHTAALPHTSLHPPPSPSPPTATGETGAAGEEGSVRTGSWQTTAG